MPLHKPMSRLTTVILCITAPVVIGFVDNVLQTEAVSTIIIHHCSIRGAELANGWRLPLIYGSVNGEDHW
jgi:hypothetical protein